ncbi:hypothetical protein LUI11_15945 [Bradyrhizobium diazoefficiens]|uniref:hypothetical protein n=1 Tax=Bradyrhizobium TaxID=374 RepID=UPI000457126D|nr:hypothetical protein [Bradyrhizobium diazoefficiens]APO49861.1 hypothetical protein BD122_06470 [Bradyrhizobium diazoefficiens]MCD9295788.1 hypothetical protein [Bradyrhizobium diazoefficiens]MCD9810297.1 hypothetical protein [Bradyrhizobium diazoefficiens]MCD9828197.1 hypothetical protein [Bradyrhizobium diazoefficiens]MCD9846959.1 hypothetical protein [Bradyrhizobium diazoefficiens]
MTKPDVDEDDDDPTAYIVAEVGRPIRARRNNAPIEKPSVNLAPHKESLRTLVRKAEWTFRLAKDELEPRLAGYKRKLEDNIPDESEDLGPEYDYSDLGNDGVPAQPEWEAHYNLFHRKGRGKPSTNQAREGGPPPIYLHGVYSLVKDWWEERFGEGSFKPSFGGADPYDYQNFNAEARLLNAIVQHCNHGYSLANVANLPRTIRDERKKPSKKNRP